jgi:curli biogenesis system outer membrane secretion channel CsgG
MFTRSHPVRPVSIAAVATFALLAAAVFAPSAEAGQASPTGPRARKVVVLDFSMAPRVSESRDENRQLQYSDKEVKTETEIRGWWFGSTDVYFSESAGKMAADLFSDAIREEGAFNLYSRENLKYYYADKKEVLNTKLKIADKDLDKALLTLNPVRVGREVGADKVVVGHICDSERRHSRAFGYFGTMNSYQVSVYDVRSGRLEYTQSFSGFRGRRSPYGAFEEDAGKFAAGMAAYYSGN